MKKLVVALSALAAFTGSALAADMAPRPYTKAPPPPVAVVNWTGCYLGGGGGYGMWNQENTRYTQDGANSLRLQSSEMATAGGRGYFGTVQGGCDYQFALGTYNLVIGAFGDYDFASLKGQLNLPNTVLFGEEKLSSQWAVGGRIGWLVTPSFLTYFSAGYTEATFDRMNFHVNLTVPPVTFIDQKTYKGYFIGAGDEYALGFLPGLFWKTEYRVSQFDRETLYNRSIAFPNNFIGLDQYDTKKWVQTIRSELVYRFNWGGGAVVAKY
jgi:outer membrane immunogenic protein